MSRLRAVEPNVIRQERASTMSDTSTISPPFLCTTSWTDIGDVRAVCDPKVYVVQTNAKVIQRCMLMTTDPGDLVLDPTCGSGTTAYVAEQWGRRWITIDVSRVAIAIARQRLLTAKYDYLPASGREARGHWGIQVQDCPSHHSQEHRPEPQPRSHLRQARADPRSATRSAATTHCQESPVINDDGWNTS